MALAQRIPLYSKLEAIRNRPLIVYVTSARPGLAGLMASDAIAEFLDQLERLPRSAQAADVLVVSNGGDPTVAWRAITLLRERVETIGVLVPQAAFSAATLLALGADEIVMHPNGNLGPVDPQITVKKPGEVEPQRFGFEEMAGFIQFAKEQIGIKNERNLHAVFDLLSKEVGAVHVGVAARASLLSLSMGEKLLRLHMTGEEDAKKARTIAESLNKAFYHHGYPLGRTEAIEIKLPIAPKNPEVEDLIWRIWIDIEEELKVRKPFSPVIELMATNEKTKLTANVVQAKLPPGTPPMQLMASTQQSVSKLFEGALEVLAVPFDGIHAVMESSRWASRHCVKGSILGARQVDLSVRTSVLPEFSGWVAVPLPPANKD